MHSSNPRFFLRSVRLHDIIPYIEQKDNIKIVFNKQNEMSISNEILKFMFEDFTILGILHYDKHYNLLINSNAKIINSKIKKEFLKIIKNI